MKTKYQVAISMVLSFFLIGFSQQDSVLKVGKKEIKSYHKKIFKLSLDTNIDSSAVYRLVYSSSEGWSQGYNKPNPRKKYRKKSFYKSVDKKEEPISKIIGFHRFKRDSNENFVLFNHLVATNKDDAYKRLLKKKYVKELKQYVLFQQGKYLMVAQKILNVGQISSYGSVVYSYYERVD